ARPLSSNMFPYTTLLRSVRYLGWAKDTGDIAFTSCLQHSFIEIRRNNEFTAGGQGGLRVLLIEHGTDANVGAVCKLRHESREERSEEHTSELKSRFDLVC